MEILVEKILNITVLHLKGKLDASTANVFHENALDLISGGVKKLIISCKELDYISSAGLRIFYIIMKEMSSIDGEMVISEPNTNVLKVFDIVSISSDVKILYSVQEALEFLN